MSNITFVKHESVDNSKYAAIINGVLWTGITIDSRFWQSVQDWIKAGNIPDPMDIPPPPPTNQELADDLAFQDNVFKAFAQVILEEINILRTEHALPIRTIQQLKNALANKIL